MWEQGGGHTSLLTGATGRKLDYHSSPSILIIPLADQVHVWSAERKLDATIRIPAQVGRLGGDRGHLFACPPDRGRRLLPVGVPSLPLTTLDMGPARQSRLISRVKVICRHITALDQFWTNGGALGGKDINQRHLHPEPSFLLHSIWCEPATCHLCFAKSPPSLETGGKSQRESSLHLLCCENDENRIWMRIAGHWIWIDCALHCNAHYVGPLCILGTASSTQCEW